MTGVQTCALQIGQGSGDVAKTGKSTAQHGHKSDHGEGQDRQGRRQTVLAFHGELAPITVRNFGGIGMKQFVERHFRCIPLFVIVLAG